MITQFDVCFFSTDTRENLSGLLPAGNKSLGGESILLLKFVAIYSVRRGLNSESRRQLVVSAKSLESFVGKSLSVSDLTEDLLNDFIVNYALDRSSTTVRNKRNQIIALWRAAASEGLTSPPNVEKIIKVRSARNAIVAFSVSDVEKLLAATKTKKRRHDVGMPFSLFWEISIRVAWDSALRWADQFKSLRVDAIQNDGSFQILQAKTNRVTVCQLSPSTMAAIKESLDLWPRELVTPWPKTQTTFAAQFARLAKSAGLVGTWKFLRRGSATDVERQHPGAGSQHLGHTPGSRIAEISYFDQSLLARNKTKPTELGANGFRQKDLF